MHRNFEKYKHLETVDNNEYYSKCNIILKKFKKSHNMNSNQYFYYVKTIMDEYKNCRNNELKLTTQ